MIRRDLPLTDSPAKWLLISQVEHARLSAELAAAWRGVAAMPSELVDGIRHHDDGWASWEASPEVDANTGRPLAFTELPREKSLEIWRDSILRSRQCGPLAGWAVAGHFVRLLADSGDAELATSQAWLAEMSSWRQSWLNRWHADDPEQHTVSLAGECLEWVRAFDWVSLWLCLKCSATADDAASEPMVLEPGGLANERIVFEAAATQTKGEPRAVSVSPWPLLVDDLEVDALGYAVQAKRYHSADSLAQNRSPLRLRWKLVPA